MFTMYFDALAHELASCRGVLITVQEALGSVPREKGAWMAVFAHTVINTIGGGHLEWQAIAQGQAYLAQGQAPLAQSQAPLAQSQAPLAQSQSVAQAVSWTARFALGPSLGQCCGGVVVLQFEVITATDSAALQTRLAAPRQAVALFGGGHVGRALVRVLAPLPFNVRWIDSRDEVFPVEFDLWRNVVTEHSDPVQAAVKDLVPGSQVLIMSFSHAEDLEVVVACLLRQRAHRDLPFIGLIGSKTKWTTFQKRLAERGFSPEECAHITSPIGLPQVSGKAPEVVSIAVAAQLLSLPRLRVDAAC